jgi:hypothetical protein
MIRMGARPIKTFGDPHRDGPLGIPKGNRLFQRKSTISRLSMFRAAACADAGGESNYYIDGTRRGAWSGRAPQSISTGDVRKKRNSPKEKVDFLWGSPKGHPFRDHHQRAIARQFSIFGKWKEKNESLWRFDFWLCLLALV